MLVTQHTYLLRTCYNLQWNCNILLCTSAMPTPRRRSTAKLCNVRAKKICIHLFLSLFVLFYLDFLLIACFVITSICLTRIFWCCNETKNQVKIFCCYLKANILQSLETLLPRVVRCLPPTTVTDYVCARASRHAYVDSNNWNHIKCE